MFRLITFGGLSLADDGATVTGAATQRSRLALLAVLATAGPAGVSRDKLLACLWPESEDERARHALKQAVYTLRRDLGNENAIAGTATLTLDPTIVTSDIREFDDAIARGDDASAVAAYAGPFLDGVFIRGAPEFDQWAGAERARLERAHLDAIGRLARAADANNDLAAMVHWWRRAAAAEPLSGQVALSLMKALAEAGDLSAAIQHARVHEAMVQAELESPADDAVLSFAERLRRGDWKPPVRTPRAASPATAPAPIPAPDSVHAAPVAVPAPQQRRKSRLVPVSIAAGILGVAALGVLSMTRAPVPTSSRRIVVAITNRTGKKDSSAVGEMAADQIVKALIQSDFVVVDNTTSSYAQRSLFSKRTLTTANDSAAALAAETGAETVVQGSFYRHGDTLRLSANIVDPVNRVIMHAVGPISGRVADAPRLVDTLANKITVALSARTDTTPGASTAALIASPSVKAFEHAARGWEMFFERPADTSSAFAEFSHALELDSAYTTPRLMRAYIFDVKELWRDLAAEVKQLELRNARMGRVELAALRLYNADLRGDLPGRLDASHELLKLSPGSVDMSLLVAISASYLSRPTESLEVLMASNPDRGINVLTPMYWALRAEAEHSLGRFTDELKSAEQLQLRFPGQLYGAQARARALGALGDTASLYAHVTSRGYRSNSMTADARTLALIGARELRAHGKSPSAAPIFAHVASLPPASGESRDQLAKHAIALYESEEYAKARTAYSALLASNPKDVDALGRLATIAVRTGDAVTAQQIDQRLKDWNEPYHMGRPTYWRAHIAALNEHPGEAVSLLHAAIAQGYRSMDLNIVTLHEERDFLGLLNRLDFRELLEPEKEPRRKSVALGRLTVR